MNIDLVVDLSCLGHLLCPNISIKNRVINNVVNNIRNNNFTILKLLPDAVIRYGWGRGEKNPVDLTSKMFFTPTKIINNVFYRKGPIDYLRQDPYEHVFLTVTKDGEQYTSPPAELGVVSLNHCTVCQIPEQCLVFLANATRIQPARACKKTPSNKQPPNPTVRHSNVTAKVIAKEIVEPEK